MTDSFVQNECIKTEQGFSCFDCLVFIILKQVEIFDSLATFSHLWTVFFLGFIVKKKKSNNTVVL